MLSLFSRGFVRIRPSQKIMGACLSGASQVHTTKSDSPKSHVEDAQNSAANPKMMDAVVSKITRVTPHILTFDIKVPSSFTFLPGQWTDFFVDIDGKSCVGGFSMTSSPLRQLQMEQTVSFAVKRTKHPVTNYVHDRLQVGERVMVNGGNGDVHYSPDLGSHLTLVAGGIGITPFMSIIRYAADGGVSFSDPSDKIRLVYSAQTVSDFLFFEELLKIQRKALDGGRFCIDFFVSRTPKDQLLAELVSHGFSNPQVGSDGVVRISDSLAFHIGRVDHTNFDTVGVDRSSVFFLCGPPNMVHEVNVALEEYGVPKDHLKYEKWLVATKPKPKPSSS